MSNPEYDENNRVVGEVSELMQIPSKAHYAPDPNGVNDPMALRTADGRPNSLYLSGTLGGSIDNTDQTKPNRVRTGSPLAVLVDEASDVFCADCHLYSSGFNNRYGDFRSSGCTACHMTYSLDGRSRSSDPNVRKDEPADPDAIAAGERAHVDSHRIKNVARVTDEGAFVRGVDDSVCVGCHSGSNRTVLQYWGIRLDQNQDVTNGTQYPANPVNFNDATGDPRLYNAAVGNNTFNGRVPEQHLTFEDYDGDGRNDIPADIHYEAGMGCIDCHGSRDLHGGTRGDPTSGKILSHMSQATQTTCQTCHGTPDAYAPTKDCTTYDGRAEQCVYDKTGNVLRHAWKDATGQYWLVSRVTGQRMPITQTRDTTIEQARRTHPLTGRPYYSPKASYHHGRADRDLSTGLGPRQLGAGILTNATFSHMDDMDCTACHASWTNNCIGCHLGLQYNDNPNEYFYSMVTGERIVLQLYAADFTYQTPVPFFLGVTSRGKISQIEPAEKVFWRYTDYEGTESAVLAFGDRTGQGNRPNGVRNAFPALGQNETLSHSMRGAVTASDEGARYCVACHLTQEGMDNFGDEYRQFIDLYRDNNDFAAMQDNGLYNLLAEHIGQNPGNQLNSPLWVHMVAGLGSGLLTMDATGCPENPLDPRADRQYCPDGAPADNFDANAVVYDVDRLVEFTGVPNASTAHPFTDPLAILDSARMRNGSDNPQIAGPMGGNLLTKLTDPDFGVILDSWFDADGEPQGGAAGLLE